MKRLQCWQGETSGSLCREVVVVFVAVIQRRRAVVLLCVEAVRHCYSRNAPLKRSYNRGDRGNVLPQLRCNSSNHEQAWVIGGVDAEVYMGRASFRDPQPGLFPKAAVGTDVKVPAV